MALERDRFEENRVDGLLYALGRGERPDAADSSDDALVGMLLDWRASTEATPFPAGPGDEAIDAALRSGGDTAPEQPASIDAARERRRKRRGMRSLSTIAVGAASVVAIAVGSVSVMAYNAQPGSPLWNANQSLFGGNSGKDNSVELVSALEKDLAAANEALQRGDNAEASRLLQSVSDRLDGVDSAADRVNLIRLRDQIQRQLDRGESGSRSSAPEATGGSTPGEKPRLEPGQTAAPSKEPQISEPAPAAPSAIPGQGENPDSSLAQIAPVPPPSQAPAAPSPSTDPVSPISPDDLSVLRAPSPTSDAGGNSGNDEGSQPTSRAKSGADSAQSPRSGSPGETGSADGGGGADLRSTDGN
ncbi:hypothetical protein [Dietzia sp.]|uniref:hypothetical protein n=1 Tax=Dietzia sp. TaxID=1871616 RepID=UPI002FDB3D13